MTKHIISFIGIALLLLFIYVWIASVAWNIRNPKANQATFLTEFYSALKFKKLDAFQKRGENK